MMFITINFRIVDDEFRNFKGCLVSGEKRKGPGANHDPTVKAGATNAQMGHNPGPPVFTIASSKRPISLRRSMRGTLTSFPAAVHRVEPDLRAALQVLLSGRELMFLLRR